MGGKETEYCGRCAMSSVVDTTTEGDERAGRDPFGDERIELDDGQLRSVSPAAWMQGIVRRIDDVATRLTYGK